MPSKVSRSQMFLWTSRTLIEVAILDFTKSVGVSPKLGLDFIAQRRERRTRTRVVNDASPHQVAVQFWQDGRQIFGQPFAFGGRQRLDGSFNFGNCAHVAENYPGARGR